MQTKRFYVAFGLIALAVLSRWLPHPHNFTPILGVALFAGARIRSKNWALLVPLIAMAISDLVLGWHVTMPFVYFATLLTGFLGWAALSALKTKTGSMVTTSFAASVLFFLITNFGVWATQGIYPMNLTGLVQCLMAGIPFFPATLGSTLAYTLVLFGLERLALNAWGAEPSKPTR